MTATFHVGDVFDVMAGLPDESVDLVLTSPPFLALRNYLPADHPDKGREIGTEPTPAEFLDTLLALTAEWGRLLTPHGSLCVELGDSYASTGGSGGDITGTSKQTQVAKDRWAGSDKRPGWPLAKSLCGIPTLYTWSLAYGRNLLTGEPSPAGMWRIRNLVVWARPNPPVGALGDKFRPATSYVTVATRAGDRWFDLDAVRTEPKHPNATHTVGNVADTRGDHGEPAKRIENNSAGAPPLDYWEIPTQPYKGAHYAAWPPALLLKPIEAMCPREVCRTCGTPRRRIVETLSPPVVDESHAGKDRTQGRNVGGTFAKSHTVTPAEPETVGWSDCGHDNYRPGVVLDPFAGSGTTLAVATGMGRDAIGIDIDERNADLARDRVGMFLTINDRKATA